MKLVITAQGQTLNDPVDLRFGRTKYLILMDTETGTYSIHNNEVNLNPSQGAGIQTAGRISDLGAEAVITGHIGPNAFKTLTAVGVKAYQTGPRSVQGTVELFKKGQLQEFSSANVEGHWS